MDRMCMEILRSLDENKDMSQEMRAGIMVYMDHSERWEEHLARLAEYDSDIAEVLSEKLKSRRERERVEKRKVELKQIEADNSQAARRGFFSRYFFTKSKLKQIKSK